MLKDITLGQYFPGNSIAHKLDPRTKILLVTLYIIALFSAKGWMGYAVMVVTLAACVKVSLLLIMNELYVQTSSHHRNLL